MDFQRDEEPIRQLVEELRNTNSLIRRFVLFFVLIAFFFVVPACILTGFHSFIGLKDRYELGKAFEAARPEMDKALKSFQADMKKFEAEIKKMESSNYQPPKLFTPKTIDRTKEAQEAARKRLQQRQ